MKRTTAIVVGFVVAPLLPAFMFAIQGPSGDYSLVALLQITLAFYFFSALFTIFLGIPAFTLLWKLRLVTWWSTLIAGFVVGSLVAIILRLPSLGGIWDIPVMGLMGSATTFVFWSIYRLGRIENEQESFLLRRE